MSMMIVKAKVKEYALKVSAEHRAGKFTRVSAEFLNRVEAKLKSSIYYEVMQHPSVGKTLK